MAKIYVNKNYSYALHGFQMFDGLFRVNYYQQLGDKLFRSYDPWGVYKNFEIKGQGFRYSGDDGKFKSGTIKQLNVYDVSENDETDLSIPPATKLYSITNLDLSAKELVRFFDNEWVQWYGPSDKYYVRLEKIAFRGNDLFKGGNLRDEINLRAGKDVAYGYGGDDIIYTDSGSDIVYGGDGNDEIDTGSGHDFAYGGRGDDALILGSGNDVGYGGSGDDRFNGREGNDRLYGERGDDHIEGHNGNDSLYGGSGGDTLKGDTGNDRLVGGAGGDSLFGGEGNDRFIFESVKDSYFTKKPVYDYFLIDENGDHVEGYDWIQDFSKGDKIDLRAIDANVYAAGNNKFKWIADKAFSGAAGELHYKGYHGAGLLFEGDVNGDKLADFAVALRNYTPTATDFFL